MAAPLKPEPKFFLNDDLYKRGLDYYLKTYYRCADADLLVEKSTSYLESIVSARRIHEAFPDARILCILRNPVERAVSHYKFSCANGFESLSLEEALNREEERIHLYDPSSVSVSPFAYRKRGEYVEYIRNYLTVFPFEKVKVIVQEFFINNQEAIADLCDFLEITFLENMVLDESFNIGEDVDYNLPEELETSLYDYYAPYNKALSDLIEGLDLSAWQKNNLRSSLRPTKESQVKPCP